MPYTLEEKLLAFQNIFRSNFRSYSPRCKFTFSDCTLAAKKVN